MPGYDEVTNTIAYQGGIHTDGYIVYDTVAKKLSLRHGGSLAHVPSSPNSAPPRHNYPTGAT